MALKTYHSFRELQADVQSGVVSCEEIVGHYLRNIEEKNKTLNAFVEVYTDFALAQAQALDARIKAGEPVGRLAGMVIGIKDVLCLKDFGLQGSSKILDKFKSQFTGTAIQRLLDEDAIIIGRQNCDEFAMGSSNENSAFGVVRNAADTTRVPGGSSGGSAVAVQADMCWASIGSDTGGSVRQPASFCGLVGLKPTYSRISRYGLIAYASSFDCIGPITRNVPDAALLLEVMAGADDFDSTVSQKPVPAYSQQLAWNGAGKKIAYLRESLESEAIAPAIRESMKKRVEFLKQQGYTVEGVEFPLLEYILPTYYILTMAEASANLSRYDGVRYGHRTENAPDLETMYKRTRAEGFGREVKRRIMLGTFVLSASYYDAYFTKAQRVRRLIKEKTESLLTEYDFLLMPTSPTTAFKIGENSAESDPLAMFLADIYSVQANVAGVTGISIPAGNDEQNLPIGLQIMANAFRETDLLAFSNYLEQQTF
ncbi:aspartyl-tRNA(Asn)/glutamyl-tRNA(Gln) amidotransferase subunit A [Flexibacter flexilis DSM 6793]|uniref:Glutamyl-tRNA(Gln) amidotransferase subunit A n=1 Tax=Flexibacter flexilis DSM 6793 TaxID=927664 RepID=A0A1I1DWQ9_9BACT|nr:aspartyl-tRNA(Asn)/glutamyl-tRNA(Gln) amidotransferase subunit A [Flexibacter flexilis DSM 6793]